MFGVALAIAGVTLGGLAWVLAGRAAECLRAVARCAEMLWLLALATVAMPDAGTVSPTVCNEGDICHETWRATVDGVEVRIVEWLTADAHAARREAIESIYVHGAAGWFVADVSWSMFDIAMSTVRTTLVTHRRVRTGTLADDRPVVLLQINLRDDIRDRGPPNSSTTERRSLLVACTVDRVAPACTSVISVQCGAHCGEAQVSRGEVIWSGLDGQHRESLTVP